MSVKTSGESQFHQRAFLKQLIMADGDVLWAIEASRKSPEVGLVSKEAGRHGGVFLSTPEPHPAHGVGLLWRHSRCLDAHEASAIWSLSCVGGGCWR